MPHHQTTTCSPRAILSIGDPEDRGNCCDKNVIVLCSERVYFDQNGSRRPICKGLKNQIEERIFITDQNTLGDLQNRGPRHPLRVWFLIAGEQITQAKNHVNQSMTMEQLLEAEQRAAEWIRKMRKIPPSSIENPPKASMA